MKLTAIGSGYYRVYVDGIEVSKHTSEREAIESAFARETADPSKNVTYKHDYEVKVESLVPPPPSFDLNKPFRNDSWIYKKAGTALDPDSASIVTEIVLQAKDATAGGTSIFYPGIAFNKWSVPIFHITNSVVLKKTVIYSTSNGNKAIDIRVPDNFVVAGGTDAHAAIYDHVEGVFADFWQLDPVALKAVHGGMIQNFPQSDGTFPFPMGARACGIAATVGVVTLDSIEKGVHEGVVAIATPRTNKTPKWPANRVDGYAQDNTLIRMGHIYRLPPAFIPDPTWPLILRLITVAYRDYGGIVIDTTNAQNINMAYIEDPRPRGKTTAEIKSLYWGGKADWQLGQMFPWNQLQVLA